MVFLNQKNKITRKLKKLDDALATHDIGAAYTVLKQIENRLSIRLDSGYPVEDGNHNLVYDDTAIANVHAVHLDTLGQEVQHDPRNGVSLPRTVLENDAFVANLAASWVPSTPQAHTDDIDQCCSRKDFMAYVNSRITEHEVELAINKGKDSSAAGIDGISYRLLKMLDPDAHRALAKMFSACLETGTTPRQWRVAKVKMLFKLDAAAAASGEAKHPTNYRGISLLDCIGKTFERVLHRRMMQYVDKFNLLDDNQNGFRPERSTEMHLLTLEELLTGGGTDLPVCFLDIRKAFPSVRRSSLLQALHDMGFEGAIWKVIQSMYEDNISFVECGAGKSVEYGVHNGIREGAILSPLLYIIFINELLTRIWKSQKGSHDIALIGLPATRYSKGVHLQQLGWLVS